MEVESLKPGPRTVSDSAQLADVWQYALDRARQHAPTSFEKWFSGIQLDGFESGALFLCARDEFVRDWVRTHYLPTLLGELAQQLGRPSDSLPVHWRISSQLERPACQPPPPSEPPRPRRLSMGDPHALPSSHPPPSSGTFHQPGHQSSTPSSLPPTYDRSMGERPAPGGSFAAGHPGQGHSGQGPDAGAHPPSRYPSAAPPGAASHPHSTRDSNPPMTGGYGDHDDGSGLRGGNYQHTSTFDSSARGLRTLPAQRVTASGVTLNPKQTFDNFVVGPSNELAYAAAVAAAGGGGPRYNPLFICGGTGLGKTHLMHAIAHRLLAERPNACVLYVSAERFTNEFIGALQHHKMEEFRSRYRQECDLLLLDDIQFLAGREQTQEEFFHTFNALRDADKQIVVSSDKYPQDLQRMPERLISRFTSGLVADVHVPALETRVAIVRKKAALEGIQIGDDVAILLAQNVKSNIRELEGTLIRLAAKSSLTHRPIDLEFARTEIAMIAPRHAEVKSVDDIQRAVCNHFSLTNAELLSKDRHKSVAFARQVAMYLCRQRLKCSFPELGRAFGNRDHTTVMSAVRRVEALRKKDPEVNAHLEAIEHKLASTGE